MSVCFGPSAHRECPRWNGGSGLGASGSERERGLWARVSAVGRGGFREAQGPAAAVGRSLVEEITKGRIGDALPPPLLVHLCAGLRCEHRTHGGFGNSSDRQKQTVKREDPSPLPLRIDPVQGFGVPFPPSSSFCMLALDSADTGAPRPPVAPQHAIPHAPTPLVP